MDGTFWSDMPCMGILLVLLFILGGCCSLPQCPSGADGTMVPDPLTTGTLLATPGGQPLSPKTLLEKMQPAQVIYLGEQHDNPYHHQLQRAILAKLLAQGKRPAIGFEFFSRDQTGWLMQFTVGKPSPFALPQPDDPGEALRKKLGWEKRPDWANYFPLLELAREYHLPVFGADLPDGLRVRLTRSGLEGLSAIERAEWSSTGFSQESYRQLMLQKLSHAHCGMAPESLLERQYVTWLARNDAMAHSIALIVTERPDEPVLMILGAGHVAHDMGVYERVAFLQPGIRQFNLGFKGTDATDPTPARFLESVQMGETLFPPEHPFVWLTPAAPSDADPCAKLLRPGPKGD
ncbi:MAG: ChaN family lipoprotein [Magnetococcales bacterium]|nr:ChaN family lipoprotein [Magnetococcales bacterium]